jgi:branched-chain amino acid transport system substrate-binding protein
MTHRLFVAIGIVGCLCAALVIPRSAGADQLALKLGLLATFSGFFALNNKVTDAAIAAFIKEHDDTVAGHKLEIIKRDDAALPPKMPNGWRRT